jgi:hypothetical protein
MNILLIKRKSASGKAVKQKKSKKGAAGKTAQLPLNMQQVNQKFRRRHEHLQAKISHRNKFPSAVLP